MTAQALFKSIDELRDVQRFEKKTLGADARSLHPGGKIILIGQKDDWSVQLMKSRVQSHVFDGVQAVVVKDHIHDQNVGLVPTNSRCGLRQPCVPIDPVAEMTEYAD